MRTHLLSSTAYVFVDKHHLWWQKYHKHVNRLLVFINFRSSNSTHHISSLLSSVFIFFHHFPGFLMLSDCCAPPVPAGCGRLLPRSRPREGGGSLQQGGLTGVPGNEEALKSKLFFLSLLTFSYSLNESESWRMWILLDKSSYPVLRDPLRTRTNECLNECNRAQPKGETKRIWED